MLFHGLLESRFVSTLRFFLVAHAVHVQFSVRLPTAAVAAGPVEADSAVAAAVTAVSVIPEAYKSSSMSSFRILNARRHKPTAHNE